MTLCDSLLQGPSTPAEAEDCAASTSAEPEAEPEVEVELSDSKADSEESKSLLIKTTLAAPTPLPNVTSSSQHFTRT